jgi:hypothetical protein
MKSFRLASYVDRANDHLGILAEVATEEAPVSFGRRKASHRIAIGAITG